MNPRPVLGVPPLPREALRPRCDPGCLPFQSTAELETAAVAIGQDRAVAALRFAAAMPHVGYNAFVLGPEGAGRRTLVVRLLERIAATRPSAPDLVYVHAFEHPHRPRRIHLPAGLGSRLRDDLEGFVRELQPALITSFESEGYLSRRKALEEGFEARRRTVVERVRSDAASRGVALLVSAEGMALVPARDGEPLSPEQVQALTPEERAGVEAGMAEVREAVADAMRQIPAWAREHRERVRQLDEQTAAEAIDQLVAELRSTWGAFPAVADWLDTVRADVLQHRDRLRSGEGPSMPVFGVDGGAVEWTRRYRVNVLVDNRGQPCPRVVLEEHPTVPNLVGRVDFHAALGTLVTDHTLIRAGAFHRANGGGFLVLEARALLTQPMAWDLLKRTLRSREIRIESLAQLMSLTSTASVEPEAVAVDFKVVLVGEREIYYLLAQLDPEFTQFFKVPSDLEDTVPRTEETVLELARQLATLVRDGNLLPLHRDAVAEVVDRASRLGEDATRLTTHLRRLGDLLREADHFARAAGRDLVLAEDVRTALARERAAHGRVRDLVLEAEVRGIVRVETDGSRVGEVNGLAVALLGPATFGRPSRISARVRLGNRGVVDIEREARLGGPIHSKGVMILSSFLATRYAREVPLAIQASIVFEQSYGGVEGDSASLAELLALLSALGELPLTQSIAVTGSVDQHGRVQAIGGVNEKIEGFYALCRARGLRPGQGVVIPASNRDHLVLEDEVAASGFQVWAVETVDEALELFTGTRAGVRDREGAYPLGSANRRVEEALRRWSALAREHRVRDDGAKG